MSFHSSNQRYNNNNNNNNYNRKRKYTEESEDDYKRQRKNSDDNDDSSNIQVEDELETYLYRLGDPNDPNRSNGYTIEASIEATTSFVLNQLLEKKAEVITLLVECVSKIPEKISIYSTLIGLLNARDPNFVEQFIDCLASSFKENLKLNVFGAVHTTIRFLSDLCNVRVISTKSILDMYEKLVDVTNESNTSQMRTDFFIYCLLSSIPWNARVLYEKHGPEFDDLLESVKTYLSKRQKDYLPLLKVWSNDEPHAQEDYMDCIWVQIKKLEEDDWKENQIYRPYVDFESSFQNSSIHDFPPIIIPEFNEKVLYPLPRVIFRMFDYTDVPEEYILPGAHSIERFLVEEQLNSTINTYFLDRKLCANKLIEKTANLGGATTKLPLHYMIVEVLFGQLFQLPKPAHIEVFYGALFIELCKLQPNYIPQVLAQATELLFDRIGSMKTACIERFSAWFSYHLSNFQFKWSWDDWAECCSDDRDSPKQKFLRETLTRAMRLSYHQRIAEIIPQSMASAIVPAETKPTYRYVSEQAAELEGTLVANRLLELFKERAIPEDVFSALRDIPDKFNEADNEIESFNPLKIEVFTSTLLYFGCKSFSHAFAALAKYHMIFKMLIDNEDSQLVALTALYDTWKNHQQMIVVMVDKMLKTQIVECPSVVKWIFSDSMRGEFTSFFVWEIMHSAVHRMGKQVDKVRTEYEQLHDRFKKSSLDPESVQSEISEEELEHKLASLNTLRSQQKDLFFLLIEKFVEKLTRHLSAPPAVPNVKVEEGEKMAGDGPFFYKWSIERFEDVILTHNEDVLPYLDEIKTKFFSTGVHKSLLKVFKMFSTFKK